MRSLPRVQKPAETRSLVRRARAALRENRPEEAERLCHTALARDPRSDRALHLLGELAIRRRDHHRALARFEAAARLRREPGYLRGAAEALSGLGRLEEASAAYRAAIALDSEEAAARVGLGTALRRLGRLEEAEVVLRQAVQLAPGSGEAHHALGRTLLRRGRTAEAAEALRAAVALGGILDQAAAHADLGLALARLGRLQEAVASLRRAAACAPGDADTLSNLGVALAELDRRDEAAAALAEAIRRDPGHANAHANLGLVLARLGRPAEAAAACRRALGLRPDHANAHANLGLALLGLERFEEAAAAFERAIAREPGHAAARLNLALTLLLLGRFDRGWEAYEHRPQRSQAKALRDAPARPRWRGEPLHGRTILLHAEQGLGDAIQFARYAPEVARRGGAGRVLLLVHPLLRRLLAGLPGVDRLLTLDESRPLPPFDLECPLLSLPLAFGTTRETIPASVPYLRAEPEAVARWRARLGHLRGLRAGLAWAGNPEHRNDCNRSVPVGQLAPLWQVPGVDWVSLQVGPQAAEPGGAPEGAGRILDLAPELTDLAETAAAMTQLDLIVTVDTAVAHLAGALGRPAWVLLPRVPDWRWMLEREDSPWYPSLRLFRQARVGDWAGVVERVAAAMGALARHHR